MLKIKIPLTSRMIEIFIGLDEINSYNRVIKKMGCPDPITEKDIETHGGYSYGSVIWIEEFTIGILLHEISHSLDVIFKQMGCEDETEFKAYIWGHIGWRLENEYVGRVNKRLKETI